MTTTTFRDFSLSEIHANVIALNLPVRPGSVRDSMYRAELICNQLLQEGIVGQGKRILVVGKGPVGMTVIAALLDSKTRIVACSIPAMKDDVVLSNCVTRVICPTTCDFPAQQWTIREFPHDDSFDAKLKWRSGLAEDVLQHITQRFQGVQKDFENRLDIIEPGVLTSVTPSGSRIKASVSTPLPGKTFQDEVFDVVIICTGPGPDRVVLPDSQSKFAGFSFWSNDDLLMQYSLNGSGRRVMNLKSLAKKPVLVIGGGDGGIADFVRLLTGRFDPFDTLEDFELSDVHERQLKHLSGKMWTAFNLDGSPRNHDLLVETQRETIHVLDDAWQSSPPVRDWARRVLLSPNDRPLVQLAIPCYHFKISYFANRIAAQLLARALASDIMSMNGGIAPFRVGVRCKDIQPTHGHSCSLNALECSRHPHRVVFEKFCCDEATQSARVEYWTECSQADLARPWKRTSTDDPSAETFCRIFLRLNSERALSGLPDNVCAALNQRWSTPIRDALSCYTNCK